MQPEEWLDLAGKHIYHPDEMTQEELAQLRSNYTVWNGAIEYHHNRAKADLAILRGKIFGRGVRLDPVVWENILKGIFPEGLISKEKEEQFKQSQIEHGEKLTMITTAKHHRKFLQMFDIETKDVTGQEAPEVQEILWKTKAERLWKAIEAHRRAHVLANKQPNGLDFALWQEAELDEFHPSVHAGLQKNGFIAFQE